MGISFEEVQADEIRKLEAENERLRSEISEWAMGMRTSGIHPICSVCGDEIKKGINQQSPCKRCGDTKVEKATAGDGYHKCPDCS